MLMSVAVASAATNASWSSRFLSGNWVISARMSGRGSHACAWRMSRPVPWASVRMKLPAPAPDARNIEAHIPSCTRALAHIAPHPSRSALASRPRRSRVHDLHLHHTREPQHLEHWGPRLRVHLHLNLLLQHSDKTVTTYIWYRWNIRNINSQHSQLYICNIQIKHLHTYV
jgi:hypothetical protein